MKFSQINAYYAMSDCKGYRICWWRPEPLTFFSYYGDPVNPLYLGISSDKKAAKALCVAHEARQSQAQASR